MLYRFILTTSRSEISFYKFLEGTRSADESTTSYNKVV